MTKEEIVTKIIDRINIDPYEDKDSLFFTDPIDLDYATNLLRQYRSDDEDYPLAPDERMPVEATPELLMETFNCYFRYMKREIRIRNLAKFITDNEMVCEYENYYRTAYPDSPEVLPVDFIWDKFPFQPIGSMSPDNPLFLIELGQRSKDFNVNHEFCWYDREHNLLHSTDTPFADGVLDAKAFAEFVLSDRETLDYIADCYLSDDEFRRIFGCTAEELRKEVF